MAKPLIIKDPECDVLALEIARAAGNPVQEAALLAAYGAEVAPSFFREVREAVCWLGEAGLFRGSPELEPFGFIDPEQRHPEAEICKAVNLANELFEARVSLAFEAGRFASRVMTARNLSAWAYAGIADIAAANGANTYGVCAWDKCGAIFRKQSARAQYCKPSHRVRAAQIRAGA